MVDRNRVNPGGTIHCSLSGNDVFTDAVSNVSSIGPTTTLSRLRSLLTIGQAPPALTLDVVHEAAHHWCFNSPVGNAIAFLSARRAPRLFLRNVGLASQLASEGADDIDDLDVDDDNLDIPEVAAFGEDAVRWDTAVGMLRPLAEGIALFAELDADTNPESDYAPPPLLALTGLFTQAADRQATPLDLATRTIHRALREARISDEGLVRHANVLAQPFSSKARGYLPGYLTVKQLWILVGLNERSSLRSSDSGLFLGFLRSFFYGDYGLVHVLLDPGTRGVDSHLAISDYVSERLQTLLRDVTERDIRAYEQHALASSADQPDPMTRLDYIHTDESRYRAGLERLRGEYDVLTGEGPSEDDDAAAHAVTQNVLTAREYMHLGRALGYLTSTDGRVAIHGERADDLVLEVASSSLTPPPPPNLEGPCAVDVFYSSFQGSAERMLSVELEDWVGVAKARAAAENQADYASSSSGHALEDYRQTVLSRRLLDVSIGHARTIARAYGFGHGRILEEQLIPAAVQRTYWGLALANSRLVPSEQLGEQLEREGIAPLFEWRRDLIEGAALLSACGASGLTLMEAVTVLEDFEFQPEEVIRGLQEMEVKFGIPEITYHHGILILAL